MTAPEDMAPLDPAAGLGRRLYSSAAIVGSAFVLSRLLGLAREVIVAAQFGTSGDYDAYVAAFRIPDFLFLIVMSGAFGSAFMPVFIGYLSRGQRRTAWRLASNILTLMVEGFVVLAVLAFIFADPLMRFVVVPGLFQPGVPPEVGRTAVELTRILLLSPLFLGLGAAAKGILEAHNNFTLPAFAPVTYNAAVVLGALFLAPRYGVRGLAWGVVVGAVGHVLTQLPGLVRAGMRFKVMPKPRAEGLGTVGRLLTPRIIGQAAFQINIIVITNFASRLGESHVSALNYAYQLMMLPHGVFAIAVSTVIFPLMARQYANREFAALKSTLGDALRPLLFLTLPASAALMILARPIVQTLFQLRSFSAESTTLVSEALPYFAAGLFALAIVETTTRAYYAMHDTRTPLVASALTIAVNIVAAFYLAPRLGIKGLAGSISVTSGMEMLILLAIMRRRIGPFDPAVWRSFLKSVAATAVMAAVLLFIRPRLTAVTNPVGGKSLGQVAVFLFAVVIGAYTYVVAAWYLKSEELREIGGRVGGRLARLAGRR
ncbi:MAG TPA: murein biosynthesis integral membrane protein MurJ [Thermomicrobiales bacterium]|nr:murein biosynthesis integral membrane protein MurJ [Thermomicrobiales bacterium]